MTAAERQQQLEDLRAESCAPSPLTPASLWEINKAKCGLIFTELHDACVYGWYCALLVCDGGNV